MNRNRYRDKLLYEDSAKFRRQINFVYILMYSLAIIGVIIAYLFISFFPLGSTDTKGIDDPIIFSIYSIIVGLLLVIIIILLRNSIKSGIRIYSKGLEIIVIKWNVLLTKFIPFENIESIEKYNDNWPYALLLTPKGIARLRNVGSNIPGAGAWYSDIKVTPSDSSMNTANGGLGRIWIQASWEFKRERDYAHYITQELLEEETIADKDKWDPVIIGHGENMEWLWSVTLANPAHPTGMEPATGLTGYLDLVNRSPALDKFYRNNT